MKYTIHSKLGIGKILSNQNIVWILLQRWPRGYSNGITMINYSVKRDTSVNIGEMPLNGINSRMVAIAYFAKKSQAFGVIVD
jgi:hypothetical protein